ncbi:serine/threonine-protein kinase TNNI3K isoform X2 [Halyomorpha halys]|nr:serine/threonine-protein kinase TNNI3K [Halyomorpha halys]
MMKKKNWNMNERDGEGMTPLQWAAIRGHAGVLKKLLSFGADVHSLDYGNFTALHLSAMSGKVEAVRVLLEHGSKVNAVNADGDTPLHMAIKKGDFDVVETLLEHGAFTNISNSQGKYALDLAVEGEYLAITKLLKSVGASEQESAGLQEDQFRVNTSHIGDLFRWVNDVEGHNIPEDAVIGGTDPICNFIYVGRAWHAKHLLPAKVCPTKQFAYYSLDGSEYYTRKYQVLCSKNVIWKPVNSNEDFNHALLIGKGTDGDHFYFGRTFLEFEGNEYLTPGKIAVQQKILYLTFHYKVYEFTKFEILIIN